MELNEIKDLWVNITRTEASSASLNTKEIQASIVKRSRNTIYKFKKVLATKIILTGAVGTFLVVNHSLFSLFDIQEVVANYMSIFLGVCLLLAAILNGWSYRQIQEYEKSSYPLRISLNRVVTIIEQVVKTGIYTDVAGTTFLLILFGFVQIYGGGLFILDGRIIYLVLISTLIPLVSYQVITRIQKMKHRSHIEELKTCLSRLIES